MKITLTSALMHGSERLEPGDSLEVSDYSAQKLIARGPVSYTHLTLPTIYSV